MRLVTTLALFALFAIACNTPANTRTSTTSPTETSVSWPDVAAPAEIERADSKDVAVIVAIEDYAFLPDVPGAVANAESWRRFLEGSMGVSSVFTLYDRDASHEEIETFAKRAASEVGEGGRIWFVFIGHGAPSTQGQGLLVGMDAQQTAASLENRSAKQSAIVSALEASSASEVLMVVDACFSGRDGSGSLLAKGTQPVVPVQSTEPPDRVTVLSAARATEVAGALPGAQRPAFSYLLLGAMRGWADDGDGTVEAGEALNWTRAQLAHVPGRTQTPALHGDSTVALTRSASEADPGVADRMRGRAPATADESSRDPARGFDTGKGLILDVPAEFEMTSSVPPNFEEEGLNVIAEYDHAATGNALISVNFLRDGGDHFAKNVRTMQGAWEDRGGTLTQELAIEVDGHDAIYQTFSIPAEGGAANLPTGGVVVSFYVTHEDNLWFVLAAASHEDADALVAAMERFRSGMHFD